MNGTGLRRRETPNTQAISRDIDADGNRRSRFGLGVVALVVLSMLATLLSVAPADAQHIDGYREMEVARGFKFPTKMVFAPDGRIFVTQKQGGVVVVEPDGTVLAKKALALPNVDSFRERGLLGIVLDPDFDTNGFVYLFYSNSTGGCHHVVSRFVMTGDIIDPASETELLDTGECPPGAGGHNGGALHISGDKLFIQIGEQNFTANSQTLENLFGKILRINLDGSIPTDNPFYTEATGDNRSIWAIGMRNPFSGGIDPVTGDYFVNDVGGFGWEEINEVFPGANYGWPETEGDFVQADFPDYTRPVHAYDHGPGEFQGCAIVGGTFYRGGGNNAFPAEFEGDWLFADYCNSYIHRLDRATGDVTEVATGVRLVSDIDIGPDGNIYYLDRVGGPLRSFIRRIEFSDQPGISKQPTAVTTPLNTRANFRVLASGDGPYTYLWYQNGVPMNSRTDRSLWLNASNDRNGNLYSVDVTNPNGTIRSREVALTVDGASNTAPVVTIDNPNAGLIYTAGSNYSFSGTAIDAEDGLLDGSALTWEIVFHHDDHTHPFIEPFSGSDEGNFTIPNDDEVATNVWYRIHLTATDSQGAESTTFTDVHPRVVKMRLLTEPRGLPVALEGRPTDTFALVESVTGVKRELSAPLNTTIDGTDWVFDTWLDSSNRVRRTTTHTGTRTYVANYRVDGGTAGNGNGLLGTYFNNVDFTDQRKVRRDRAVQFAWRNFAPSSLLDVGTFSARWEGDLMGQFTETTTFSATVRGAVKITVDGQTIIDSPAAGYRTINADIDLVEGQQYPIEIEYVNPENIGLLRVYWESDSIPRSVIPTSQVSLPAQALAAGLGNAVPS